MVGLPTAASVANYGHLKMLDKLRQIPLKVKLSALFILLLFVVAAWFIPPLPITVVISLTLVYSLVTILTYFDRP